MGKGEKLERFVSAVRHLDSGNGVTLKEVRRYLNGSEEVQENDQDNDCKLLLQTAVNDGFLEIRCGKIQTAGALSARYDEKLRRLRAQMSFFVEQVAHRTDELEQFQRRNNLRVYGLAESPGENTDRLVVDLCRRRLGVKLRPWQIEHSHRVGRRRPRPLLVRFCSYRDRRLVFCNKRRLKGTGIMIVEDLTPRRLEMLKAAKARYGPRNAWSSDGKVFWTVGGEIQRADRLQDITVPEGIDECGIPASISE